MADPSSAASSLAYTNYQSNHCTSVPSFPAPVQLPQSFVPTSYATSRGPHISDSTGSSMLPPPNPNRSPISSPSNAIDREAYVSSTPFLARSQPGYGSYPDTPRSTLPLAGLSLSNTPAHAHYANGNGHMSSPGYSAQNDCGNFPWPNLEVHADMTCNNTAVTPEVFAKVEKGFFRSTVDNKWTCYRRNYFSVQCNYELRPNIDNAPIYLKRNNSSTTEMVQAMGMRLSAAVDGSGGKSIELVQHTPKRDNGPKNKIEIVRVAPTPSPGRGDHVSPHGGIYSVPLSGFHATGHVPGPRLPLQNTPDPNSSSSTSTQTSQLAGTYQYSAAGAPHMPMPGSQHTHSFERVQFKQATANNGKRRASQQYFHLIVELFADVREESAKQPVWVKVAHRVSEKIVVRGRSPSHYANEGQNQSGSRTGSSGGSSGYAGGMMGGSSYTAVANTPGFRASMSSHYGGPTGGYQRSKNAYGGFHASPEHSGSSASSVDGGANDSDYPADAVMSDAERSDIQGHDGYRYYPGPLYENVPSVQGGLPLPKIESGARFSTDPSSWAVKNEYSDAVGGAPQWPVSSVSRFQGVDSSRGYFPDLTANYS
ncbi:p53-like transcription factor [Lecanosticta acicola]|uniref:P53-like transcription factor n=1 Tax=Lecanosticta acicola TaxID=111012 RepID=A0AAI8Z1L2_9PEZI|nr:p53-like transcription factor [Lecanosticta acicola]